MAIVLIDSYSESNHDREDSLTELHPTAAIATSATGQTFTCSISAKITSAKFYLKKAGSPIGNGHAVLYALTGTYGTDAKPTGNALATSDDFDVSDLTTSYQLITFTFTGAEQYDMSIDTYYCILFENPETGTINSSNNVIGSKDESSPTHDGNNTYYFFGNWYGSNLYDTSFYVYGEEAGVTRKIKISGTFQDKPIKTKVAGTFEDKIIKIKVGGTFQDT